MNNIDSLYTDISVLDKICVNPSNLNLNLDAEILTQLKHGIENKCIIEGYVKSDSVSIYKRSVGYINNSNFTGDMTFNIIYNAKVCNPAINSIIKCKINNINKLGFLSNIGPLSILVLKDLHNNKKLFKDLNINDEVSIKIICKKFTLNDTEISIIGKFEQDTKLIKVKITK
jgi:DNA-directed RNA polymerase subunit E'/Rpb7